MAVEREIGQRISRIEGGYEHLATKADIERMKVWFIATVAAGQIATIMILLAALRLWGE